MHRHSVGIIGASGYSGVEAVRLLSRHPRVQVGFATSDRWVGQPLSRRGVAGPAGALSYVGQGAALEQAAACAAVLLCTPAEVSLELAPKLLAAGTRVIDLSGAFRLQDAETYPKWYGFAHTAAALLPDAAYGLTELNRDRIRAAKLVANAGCYATAATLPLAPLLARGLIERSSLIINAASGVTGAGRKASEDFSFAEIAGDFRAYRVLRHQHTPEITQSLVRSAGGKQLQVTFTPHLLPIQRGILCTGYAPLAAGATPQRLTDALREAYGEEPFVDLVPSADEVSIKSVVGTNRCQVGFTADEGRLVIVSAIDNLVKGAAGQAVQNLNLMLGFDEVEGLL